jgi:sugar transferase (PEP-CTERM system associated)
MSLNISKLARDEPRHAETVLPHVHHTSKAIFRVRGYRRRILIIGVGVLAQALAQMLLSRKSVFTEVIGLLAKDIEQLDVDIVGTQVVGTIDQLLQVVERHRVDTIAVCLEDRRAVLPLQSLLELKGLGVDIYDGHALYEEESGRLPIDELKPSAIIFSRAFKRGIIVRATKRTIDLLVAIAGLVMALPVLVIVAILIKLDSSGPVFYRQIRVGLRAQPYMILKFRSMFYDAEIGGPRWTSAKDARITRVGSYLRKWRLDEIPQLINVIRGEMTLVGPRPERPVFVQELRRDIPFYDLRHAVRPGITGWAQTQFRYAATVKDSHVKLQYDLYYVKNMSIRLDLRILLDTIRVVALGEGAR